jgi:hypothetical protein
MSNRHIYFKKLAIQGYKTNEGKESTQPWNQTNVTSLVVA